MGRDRVRFGAAYYHEYHRPGERTTAAGLARDLDLMRDAGFDLIRVGESVWSTWEPEDGRFELEWLAPVLDGAAERGIDVVLGTPTYALPPWLARRHPEIAVQDETGRRVGWGARQEMDVTHPAFLFHAERVVRQVVGRYGRHPAVVGIQVDNEPGLRLLHNRPVVERFVDHLRATYGTVDALNEAWGLTYWSHRLSTWADLWEPHGNLQPEYDLAWRRFQAQVVTDYIGWQADVVRDVLGPEQPAPWVTTCISYDQVGVGDVGLAGVLDVAAANVYYTMQDGLAHPSERPMSPGWVVDGTWGVYQLADLAYSSRQAPFLVTETNAGAIGHASMSLPAYDGQWRQVAWALVSRGAQAVEYWHWHTLHYGTETWWGGVLPHDGEPGRVYAELARIGGELAAAGETVVDLVPDADVALLYSSDAKWSLAFGPQATLTGPDGRPDPDSYRRMLLPFYRGAFDAGLQVGTVRPEQLFGAPAPDGARSGGEDPAAFAARRPVLVVPAYYPAHDADLAWLRAYAHAGGHLVVGPRTAHGDHEGRARTARQPAGLAEAAGAWYQESETLAADVRVTAAPGSSLVLGADAAATSWADYLVPDGAQELAGFDDPHRGRWAAVTSAAAGAGRVTTVGVVPNGALARDLLAWLVPVPCAGWADLPASVRVTSARGRDGRRLWFVHHWGWGSATVTVPATGPGAMADVVDGATRLVPGDALELGPWDVRVLVEAPAG